MRRVGKIIVVTAAAAALGACSPNNEEPSDLPPGTDPTPSQQASASASTSPSSSQAQGPACKAEDIEVTGDFGQEPEITIPDDCAPPQELISEDLSEGDGPEATEGSTVEVNYKLKTWSDGEVKDNSFERGETFPLENLGQSPVIDGWNQGLIGITEGSRRLLVIPPDLAYGEGGQGIAANETLVFVVDAVKVTPA
ncbi:peptidylprolyl isomerase [Amycolatopsis marina]|uniref:Peptidyl-prolyl cis-trans isomerase n=1 Tax=Amycolatopsis marina TaxID=490629 RepID=A0A1I0ZAG2_9PSEU|nr:FKBP-type peptidyl-prolyl cis-trans isomerase [Amycolatopsis marina]SFB21223.1 peptidylprolyl isomerase [Amycolatopsis marina]